VMALCSKAQLLPATHSCVSQRLELHDGTCHGCVVRRLAAVAAGVPDVAYARNPIVDESANAGNLLAVLDFCSLTLTDRSQLPACARQIVDTFRKWEMFERFALDNVGALHRLRREGTTLAPAVEAIYERTVKQIGSRPLVERLAYLRALTSPTVR
jgi:hypothetical protein